MIEKQIHCCPYCNKNFERKDMWQHIQDKHTIEDFSVIDKEEKTLNEIDRKSFILKILIVKTIGLAIGSLRGMNASPDLISELESNFDYITEEFTK